MSLETQFWEKVDRSGEDECWLWTGSCTSDGYGNITVDGSYTNAHRVAYSIANGPIGSKWVLHTCDNPSCVNPNHLYLGTPSDNIQDEYDRDRRPPIDHVGENNPNAKLTERDVREIKRKLSNGDVTQQELADEYGVPQSLISGISTGEYWADVAVID